MVSALAPSVPTAGQARVIGEAAPRPDPRRGLRADIEGLRAVAILLVVLYHAGVAPVRGGYVGVDVFFVISGFVITSRLAGELGTTGRLAIGRFYARRVLRLLPAATLVIVSTLAAAWYWLPATRLRGLAWDALSANGYVLNYRLAVLGTDYRTATAPPSALQHFWSLGVEEQFYLVWPLLLVVTVSVIRRRGALAAVVGLVTAGSLAWSVLSTGRLGGWAYFGAPSRAWELGAGALLALTVRYAGRLPGSAGPWLRWLGVGAIGLAAVGYGARTPFPGYAAVLPVAGTVAVIAAGCADPGRVLSSRLLGAVGARSYSWYLWHWPVPLIAPYALGRELHVPGRLAAAAVAYGLAVATYGLVEMPLRGLPALRSRSGWALATGLGMTATAATLAVLVPLLPARTPAGVASVAEVTLAGDASAQARALAQRIEAATRAVNLPANLTPTLRQAAGDDPDIYRDGCHLTFAQTRTPAHCEALGDPGSATLVVLFGDSHAAQWYPALDAIARDRHWRLAVFTKGACSAATVRIYLDALHRPYDECVAWRTATLARIRSLRPAMVVMSSNADGGTPLTAAGDPTGSVDAAWVRAWEATTRQLVQPGTRVTYLDDTPWPKGNVPDCLALHPRDVPRCARDTASAAGAPRRSAIARSVRRQGATVVEPMPWFCTLKSCPVVVGNILVYHDDSHLTTAYARLLAPLLAERLHG